MEASNHLAPTPLDISREIQQFTATNFTFLYFIKKNLHISDEKKLLEDIKKEPSKFGGFFDEYYASIFGYIFRRVADYDIAKDIASETFLKAFLNIASFKWRGVPVSVWLYRIASQRMPVVFQKQEIRPRLP